jgi:hypothetical protein
MREDLVEILNSKYQIMLVCELCDVQVDSQSPVFRAAPGISVLCRCIIFISRNFCKLSRIGLRLCF